VDYLAALQHLALFCGISAVFAALLLSQRDFDQGEEEDA
jgi:hypothetical protein